MLRRITLFTVLVALCSLMTGCITSVPTPTRTTALNIPPDSQADPAAWGVYSRLVGYRFSPPTSGFPGYKLEWTQPGEEIQETLLYLPGAISEKVFWTRRISLGANPGELISEYQGVKWLGTIEADGSVLFVRDDRVASYRRGLTERGELLHQDVDVTADGKLAEVNHVTPYPILDPPTQPAETVNSQQLVAAAQSPSPQAAGTISAPTTVAEKAPAEPEDEALITDRKAAERGDADAQNRLGMRFAEGDGVAEDDAQAVTWFRKAAAQGHVAAQFNLGNQYGSGSGVAQSDIDATHWYRKAAEQGDAAGQLWLGRQYDKGKGVPVDTDQAIIWYRKAADQGFSSALLSLAHKYREGDGVPEDDAQAVTLYRKAAEQNDAYGQIYMAMAYENGEGVAKDDAQAVAWYRKAAEQGNPAAQASLGHKYRKGEGVPKDGAQALDWYRKAAEQNDQSGQLWTGLMLDNGEGVPEDDAQAAIWYRKAAEQGEATAMNNLGVLYDAQHNDALAETWFHKAIEHGSEMAQTNLDAMRQRQANAARQTYDYDDYDEEPEISGAQLFMGALGAFSQAYGDALVEQAASDAQTQAMINQITAAAQAEEHRREAAARAQQQAAYEQQTANQQQQYALQQQAEQQRQAEQVAQQQAERERQQEQARQQQAERERQAEQQRRAALIATPEAIYVCTLPNATDGKFRCMGPVSGGIDGGPKNSLPEWRSPQAMLANSRHQCPNPRRLQSTTHLVWGCGFGATGTAGYEDRSAGVDVAGRTTFYCSQGQTSCRRTSR